MDINWGGVGGILEGERDSAGSRGIQEGGMGQAEGDKGEKEIGITVIA